MQQYGRSEDAAPTKAARQSTGAKGVRKENEARGNRAAPTKPDEDKRSTTSTMPMQQYGRSEDAAPTKAVRQSTGAKGQISGLRPERAAA